MRLPLTRVAALLWKRSQVGDLRRTAIATVLAENTTLKRKRIAGMLNRKSAGNVSQQVLRFQRTDSKTLNRKIRQFLKNYN